MSAEEIIEEARLRQIEGRWKSDVDRKLDALIRAEEEHRRKYGGFLDILIQRESDRAMMRRAVIEKTLAGLIWMAVVGLLSLAWSGGMGALAQILNAARESSK